MKRIGLVARRDFVASITTKGFLIGLLVMPALAILLVAVAPRIMNSRSPQVRGEVEVIDRAGGVVDGIRAALDPEAIRARRADDIRRTMSTTAPALPAASGDAIERAIGRVPSLRIVEDPVGADVQAEKRWLLASGSAERHLALVVVHPDAVVRDRGNPEFGTYDLYVSSLLDDATESAVVEGVREALVGARLRASKLERTLVEASMRVSRPRSVIVAAGGEQRTDRGFTRVLPFILGLLMFVGVMIGGQTLMTSTIEEKSSRVVEVLLAAVSPFELMAGKLLGQLGVGLIIVVLYTGFGLAALFSFALIGLVDPILVLYLVLFFLITYLVFGALMVAIGAAVNQIADAQALMGPVVLLLVAPYAMAPMISRAPNSTFSVIASFVPPINTFVMMSRLASGSPPPTSQVLLTMAIGLGAALGAVWFAGKVFKVGLLMHGKPPTLATLVRWARNA